MSSLFPSIPAPQALLVPLARPTAAIARSSILSLFFKLTVGQLELRTQDGQVHRFGDPTLVKSKQHNHESSAASNKSKSAAAASAELANNSVKAPHAIIIVRNESFWTRMFFGADLGFAEAYMIGDVDTLDLAACFDLFILNRASLSNLESISLASSLISSAQTILNKRYANTKVGSLRNIGAHYDISNTMYKAFLSKDMTYSCAVFDTLDADVSGPLLNQLNQKTRAALGTAANVHVNAAAANGVFEPLGLTADPSAAASAKSNSTTADRSGDLPTPPSETEGGATEYDELEEAQKNKLRLIIKLANIRPGDRVLEIGTGWGSFAIEAVRTTGCKVDSVTLSVEQKALAEQRIAAAGMESKIKVHLMDYRDFPASWTDSFDRVCSIEMLEAVGIEFLPTYFSCVDRVLKRNGGVAVFQCITMPENRAEAYYKGVDFIKKWIFPGGVLPSVTSLVNGATDGSNGNLILDTLVSIGPHYARTLREWKNRFEANFDKVIRPALLRDHNEISRLPEAQKQKEVEVFRRKWIYYFVYCEVGFTHRVINDHILAFTRENNTTLPVCSG
ncbi:related to cyclopropane-fatty-acyl-phospholipid synthase [Ustilago bromivora]|uniref:Related to cyclopropane-fatty-acyl-phospholipid synthase n=1 Tax=Ustilago bromivora TaxID=307758 RepID=A0A1K0FYI9_9BASI|nr:related to cyclopropane-fatty-acyl-phospholipid synthase [Ustilago bromivora]SYW84948.1 related to cyclopropane-fatty-acyl-phospholipid synthase [Ustilago bromivora]